MSIERTESIGDAGFTLTTGTLAPRRSHRWLLLLPFAWQVGLTPWANDVQLRPLGLPFLMFWQMAGIVFTSAVIAGVFALDRRAEPRPGNASSDEVLAGGQTPPTGDR